MELKKETVLYQRTKCVSAWETLSPSECARASRDITFKSSPLLVDLAQRLVRDPSTYGAEEWSR